MKIENLQQSQQEINNWYIIQNVIENVRNHITNLDIRTEMIDEKDFFFGGSVGHRFLIIIDGAETDIRITTDLLESMRGFLKFDAEQIENELTFALIHEIFRFLGIKDDLIGPQEGKYL